MPTLLTKSKFIQCLACPRYFWTLYHEPERIPKADDFTQHLFDQGHLVGELAKKVFPSGISIPYDDFKESIKLSKELIAKRKSLFEAGFLVDGCYARADILLPCGSKEWDIVEVKSSTGVKEEHLYDLAFQKRCYEKAGLKIRKCFLMHINGDYVKNGEIEPNKLLEKDEVTEDVEALKDDVEKYVNVCLKIIASPTCPVEHCKSPKSCPFPEDCWGDLPEDNVFTLYSAGKKAVELYESGVASIKDIPDDYELNDKQEIQKEAVINGKPHIDKKAIASFLSGLQYPIHFLDFETFQMAVPLFDGTKPYQQIPFQFCLCIVEKEGSEPKEFSFLAENSDDPRPALLKALQKDIKKAGSIVVYNQSFEKRVFKELAEALPKSSEWVNSLFARFIDLLVPFRNFQYYNPAQKGSASIKEVLPAVTGKGYSELDIKGGGMASLQYLKMTYIEPTTTSKAEEKKIRKALEEYCAMDTRGMVEIVKMLVEMGNKRPRRNPFSINI